MTSGMSILDRVLVLVVKWDNSDFRLINLEINPGQLNVIMGEYKGCTGNWYISCNITGKVLSWFVAPQNIQPGNAACYHWFLYARSDRTLKHRKRIAQHQVPFL